MNRYTDRIERLQAVLREESAALAVLSFTDQMRYIAGIAENGHERFLALLVPAVGSPAFVVPALNAQQVRANPAAVEEVLQWDDATGPGPVLAARLGAWGIRAGDAVIIDDELHAAHLMALQEVLPGLRCRPAGPVLARLRGVKGPDELAAMQRAATLVDETVEEALGALREGMTEKELAGVILAGYDRRGTSPSFAVTVCFGPNTAIPHHSTSDRPLALGDVVLIDTGCLADGYCSDITRTVSFGEPSDPDVRAVYAIVNAAHHAGRAAALPGVAAQDVDAAARKVIADAGYGERFNHRLGHGIGLSVHEPPHIVRGNAAPLLVGQCFSVEPGIYLPERFGVRIENIAHCAADGCRSFNADAPAELKVVEPR